MVDCAAGGGYVCAVYKPQGGTQVYVQIVRESDDQVIFLNDTDWTSVRCAYASDRFFFLSTDGSGNVELSSFTPASSVILSTIATLESTGFTFNTTFMEINAVTNGSNSTVICAYGLNSGSEVRVKRYNATGTQQGSTLTISGLSSLSTVDVEADEVDNTDNVLINTTTPTVTLHTYNFSNKLLDGPTSCT